MRMFWRQRDRASGPSPNGPRRRRALRLQLEALEDRLAPSCTLVPVAQSHLPFGVPVVACTADAPAAASSSTVLRVDLSDLGLAGAMRVTIVFHFEGSLTSAGHLQYFDEASQSWRPAQASTQVADSLALDSTRGTVTVVFDDTATPALRTLSGRRFRVGEAVSLPPVVGTPSPPVSSPLPTSPTAASGFFDMASPAPATLPRLDTSGFSSGALEEAPAEALTKTHAAFWMEEPPVASDPNEPVPPPDEGRPPSIDEPPQLADASRASMAVPGDLRSPASAESETRAEQGATAAEQGATAAEQRQNGAVRGVRLAMTATGSRSAAPAMALLVFGWSCLPRRSESRRAWTKYPCWVRGPPSLRSL